MAWLGIWYESAAAEGGPRSPEMFHGLVEPIVYPFAHTFIEEETKRLKASRDPCAFRRGGERFNVYYSLNHDGCQSGLDQQGCSIIRWLFEHFGTPESSLSARFSEIPIVLHTDEPLKAAAMANALVLMRFLGATEDQAIAKILIHRWSPFQGSPRLAAEEYERRVIDFLHGEIFYPEGVNLFDILERNDLKAYRDFPPCCLLEIGFIGPLLEWIDECWPKSEAEAADLLGKVRNSLRDEARFLKKKRKNSGTPY
jgi:hypothetical protein